MFGRTLTAIALVCLTAACAKSPETEPALPSPTSSPSSAQAAPSAEAQPAAAAAAASAEEPAVTVQGTVTLSRNELYPFAGQSGSLNLVLVRGTYQENWDPGPLMGPDWSGQFELQWRDERGTLLASLDLSRYYAGDDMHFSGTFPIAFDDYNGDGNPDFTIGQYGSGNGNFYRLFTLTADRRIEPLAIKGGDERYISAGDSRYSTALQKAGDRGFKLRYYDNSVGKYIEEQFEWDGDLFVKVSNVGEAEGGENK